MDPATGLYAYTADEVERQSRRTDSFGPGLRDWYGEPLAGHVIEAAAYLPPISGEGAWRHRMVVRTGRGLVRVEDEQGRPAELFKAEVGAPVKVTPRPGEGFDVVVGEPDTHEEEEREAALIAAAEKLLQRGKS
jgi:hypothetical protein